MTQEPKRPRADATRNRDALLAAATAAFVDAETEPSMREIARLAEVGVGTLYRHFPTREALVIAIYRDQVERLSKRATQLAAKHAPAQALRLWMDAFAGWVATKKGMHGTLHALVDAGELSYGEGRPALHRAIEELLAAGVAAGELRGDVSADDVATLLVGTLTSISGPLQKGRTTRLLDVLMDGLRAR